MRVCGTASLITSLFIAGEYFLETPDFSKQVNRIEFEELTLQRVLSLLRDVFECQEPLIRRSRNVVPAFEPGRLLVSLI